jgi:hypothetical protein
MFIYIESMFFFTSLKNDSFDVIVCLIVFNTTFNNISVTSWWSVDETGLGENHQPGTSHWQTLSHNVVHLPWSRFELTSVVIGTDCCGSCKSNYHTITTMMGLLLMLLTAAIVMKYEDCSSYCREIWRLLQLLSWNMKIAAAIVVKYEDCCSYCHEIWRLLQLLSWNMKIAAAIVMKYEDCCSYCHEIWRLLQLLSWNMKIAAAIVMRSDFLLISFGK